MRADDRRDDPADGTELPPLTPSVERYLQCTPAERADAITQLLALKASTEANLLDVATAACIAGDPAIDGAATDESWFALRANVGLPTARRVIAAGRALAELPALREAFGEGRLSWEQVQPATTFATVEDDIDLAEDLPGLSVAQIEQMARHRRLRTTEDACETRAKRHLRRRVDHAAGGVHYSVFLPAEDAAVVDGALDRRADDAGPDAETGSWAPIEHRRAGAFVDVCRSDLGDNPPESAVVVVHVQGDVAAGERDGNAEVNGITIASETSRRMMCDCKVEFSVDNADGVTIGVGRATRNPPHWLGRRVRHRDNHVCRFPGCGRKIRHIHHIKWWGRDKGPTDASNLAGLCFHHHHLVHEGGWHIVGDADDEIVFVSPWGTEWRSRCTPLRPEVRARAEAAAGVTLS